MTAWSVRWRAWSPVRKIFVALAITLGVIFTLCAILVAIEIMASKALFKSEEDLRVSQTPASSTLERGAYLAKVGNCAACHTARGGAPFAGGDAIHTPFGAVYTSNITPDPTGIGNWSAQAFYRAMHEGRSANGRLLTPAFPYPNYTHVTRDDSDALYAFFMHSVQPVSQVNRVHELPFPFNTQIALAVWRLMFFQEQPVTQAFNTTKNIADKSMNDCSSDLKSCEIERGAYLVRGLGHCSACHSERNALGATTNDQVFSGALMPMQDWYAPSLMDASQAGVMHWPKADVVALLQTGVAPHASVAGPMAQVVSKSTQFWSDADLQATAAYLQSLPETMPGASKAPSQNPQLFERGAQLFAKHCISCHGAQGQGVQIEGAVALPALAGNRAVTMRTTANLVRIILAGGYAPSTAGNPRPFGMPPFVHVLDDNDIAAVTTFIRGSWGNQADAVSAADVVRHRKGLLQ
jgi:mono/diheme cytochrome c family protein